MNRLFRCGVAVALLNLGLSVHGYEVNTHDLLSAGATSDSVLYQGNVLADLGLTTSSTFPSFSETNSPLRSVLELVSRGAVFEDDLSVIKRPYNHFFDPQFAPAGRGLDAFGFVVGQPSPTWALEDTGDVVSLYVPGPLVGSPAGVAQQYSFRNAQQYFFAALTQAQKTNRNNAFGSLFQTLGQVIHHVQDMGQPQHTRNETHNQTFQYVESRFEHYTNALPASKIITLSQGYPAIPTFATSRQFWTEAGVRYRGMADFVARNFISSRTGYQSVWNGNVESLRANPGFPLPAVTNFDGTARTIEARPASIQRSGLPTINTTMDFVVGKVYDEYTGVTYPGRLMMAGSLLDPHLRDGRNPRTWAVNNETMDDSLALLLPRARAFSAGLINHFFRGRLNLRRKNATGTTWVIENLTASSGQMNGSFRILSESATGVRAVAGGPWTLTINAGSSAEVTLTEPSPAPAKLVVVFNGRIGSEPANLNDPNWYAVAGKVIAYSGPAVSCAGSRSDSGGSAGIDFVHEMGSTAGNIPLEFEAYGIPDSIELRAENAAKTLLASSSGQISGFRTWSASFNPATLGTTKIRLKVTGNTDTGTRWNTAIGCPGTTLGNSDRGAAPRKSIQFQFGSALAGASGGCSAQFYIDGAFVGNINATAGSVPQILNVTLSVGPQHYGRFQTYSCMLQTQNFVPTARYQDAAGLHDLPGYNTTATFGFDVQ